MKYFLRGMVMKNKKKIIKILIILLLVFSIHELSFLLDKNTIGKGKPPLFALSLIKYKDGGSVVYYGFGYQVLRWHRAQLDLGVREVAYEIYRFPLYKKWDKGPKATTQYFDYQP